MMLVSSSVPQYYSRLSKSQVFQESRSFWRPWKAPSQDERPIIESLLGILLLLYQLQDADRIELPGIYWIDGTL
jgi:hypothetical protein